MPIKSFVWGIESWQKGENEFIVKFDHPNVRIIEVSGTVSAAPQPNHQPFFQLIRQSLIALVNVGSSSEAQGVSMIKTPNERANQSITSHLFSLNIKQLNSDAICLPFSYNYRECPVLLASSALKMHVLNESYKMENGAPVVSTDQNDALNIEMHLRVLFASG